MRQTLAAVLLAVLMPFVVVGCGTYTLTCIHAGPDVGCIPELRKLTWEEQRARECYEEATVRGEGGEWAWDQARQAACEAQR